jgi:glycosyltransferase involved in cell wall biosynthesis
MRPYLRALLHVGGEEGSATGEVTPARWVTLAGTPLVVVARLARATATTCRRLGRAGRYQANRLRERGSIHAPLRWFTRALARGLKSATEAGIRLLNGVLRTFAFPLRSLSYYRLTYRTVTRDLPRPAIIHANDLDTLLIAVVLSKRFRVPLIYDAQEFYTGLHTLPGWYKRFLSVQERLLIRHADGVTVVNDAIADVMARKYGVRVSSVVLNCPPYEERPSPATRGTVRAAARVPDEEVVLLYSGGLTKNRGIENTILALRYLPGASLVVLGEGALKEALEELAGANGLRGRVLFKDFIPHRDVPRFISSADVGIIPYENVGINHYLCSPSKLFHYIMAELPIACSDFPFLRQVVVTNELGKVFDPSDPESIADAVRGLVSVPGTLAACRARLNLVKRRYCWEEEARKMMAVYRSVAPAARLGAPSESLLGATGLADR